MNSATPLRVLVVTDAPLGGAAQRALHALKSYRVVVAKSAEEGLRAVGTITPDLVVVDLDLPGKGGAWLLSRIVDGYVGRPPKLLLLSDVNLAGTRTSDLKPDAVLLKPVERDALVATVEGFRKNKGGEQLALLRALVQSTLLSSDLIGAAQDLTQTVSRALRAKRCLISTRVGDERIAVSSDGRFPGDDDPVWLSLQVALGAKVPVVEFSNGKAQTTVVVPIDSLQQDRLGFMVVSIERVALLDSTLRKACRDYGRRLHSEINWLALHNRIATDRKKLQERQAFDPTVGLWTRSALEEHVPQVIAEARVNKETVSFAILDICGVRDINRRLGYSAGDALLKHMAGIVKRESGARVHSARFRGDRFALVFVGLDTDEASARVQHLQESIAAPLNHEGLVITGRATAGMSTLINAADTAFDALSRADIAVGYAKEAGEGLMVHKGLMRVESTSLFQGLDGGMTLGDNYQILHEISRGAMGVVYRAEDLGLRRPVALKTLRPALAKDEDLISLFKREAATLARLRHDNLVQVYSFGVDDGRAYFAMELVEGESLADRIDEAFDNGQFVPLATIRAVLAQIAAALDTLHDAGIMHRDVKPSNVLLDRTLARAVLVDFGIATGDASELPAGTPGFAAPEVFQGLRPTPAGDAYGLAATVYSALTNIAPFDGGTTPLAVVSSQLEAPPTPPSAYRPELGSAVDEVMLRALAPQPNHRYVRASEFAADLLEALSANVPATGKPPAPKLPKVPARPRTKRIAAGKGSADRKAFITTWRQSKASELPRTGADRPMSRGLLFRSAYQACLAYAESGEGEKADTLLGAAWLEVLKNKRPEFEQVFSSEATATAWFRTETLCEFLAEVAEKVPSGPTFARAVGGAAAAATFVLFAGGEASQGDTRKLLNTALTLWPQWHSWGELELRDVGGTCFEVLVSDGLDNSLLCSLTRGVFEYILEPAGGHSVSHTECRAHGDPRCVFFVAKDGN